MGKTIGEEEAIVQWGFEIIFDDNGEDKSIFVDRRPLGAIFEKDVPIKVASLRPRSYAQSLGIRPGWILKSVNGESVLQTCSYVDAIRTISRHVDSLPEVAAAVP